MNGASVSVRYARAFVRFLESYGAYEDLTKRLTSASGALVRVPADRFSDAVRRGIEIAGDPAVGLKFGSAIGGDSIGLLAVACASADTLSGAIGALVRMESLTSTLGNVDLCRKGELVYLRWEPRDGDLPSALVESVISGWASFGRYLLAERVPIHSVSFSHAPAISVSRYEEVFESPVQFRAGFNQIAIKADCLDAKTRFSDYRVSSALRQWHLESTGVAASSSGSIVRRTASSIEAGLASGVSEESVARQLNMSKRSLQRALAEDGFTYRGLLDCVRGKVAIDALIDRDKSLARIGEIVGYAEQSSLSHAFRRWVGVSPRDFIRLYGNSLFGLQPPDNAALPAIPP